MLILCPYKSLGLRENQSRIEIGLSPKSWENPPPCLGHLKLRSTPFYLYYNYCLYNFYSKTNCILRPDLRHPKVSSSRAGNRKSIYSNLPNKCTDSITEFWEKTLFDVSRLFLVSENYFNWLTRFLVLLHTEGQESSQSIEIIFTGQKYS